MIHVITYDLHNPGRDYEAVAAYIKAQATSWAHPQGSVWLVDSAAGPAAWRDGLASVTDENDEFFVSRLAHNWASTNMDADVAAWLKNPARSW